MKMATDQAQKFDQEISNKYQLNKSEEKTEKHETLSADSEQSTPIQPVNFGSSGFQPFAPPMPMYFGIPFIPSLYP